MTIRYVLAALIATLALASCKKELEPQEASVPMTAASSTSTPAPAQQIQQVQPQQAQMQQPQAVTMTPQPTAPQQVAKGMNPPHGQPGHRCDIPVGSPLSTPVKNPATPQVVQNAPAGNDPVTITPAVLSSDGKLTPGSGVKVTSSNGTSSGAPALLKAPAETKPGMNPPHGQPGHRCDIAVGQPLPTDANAPATTTN